jgi:hypothetical protein
MAVLVDELREYPGVALPYTRWCHLATDGSFEELHAFAARLRLRRAWFDGDHYDLPPHGRARAVALGAEEVATADLLQRMTGPRGDRTRTRRRVLTPSGHVRLRGADDGPRVLRYPAGALVVVVGTDPGAFAAQVVNEPLAAAGHATTDEATLAALLAGGSGAVVTARATSSSELEALAGIAAKAGCAAHLLLLDDRRRAASHERFVSVTELDRAAAARVRRLRLG